MRQDIPAALSFFHSQAFSNDAVLDQSCPGDDYIQDAERQIPEAIKQGVSKYLKDGSTHIKGNSLHNILFLSSADHPKQSVQLAALLKKITLNNPNKDRYFLVGFKSFKSLSKNDDNWKYFEGHYDLSDAFITVIQYRVPNEDERYGDDIVVMLLWARDKSKWKIIFVGSPTCVA